MVVSVPLAIFISINDDVIGGRWSLAGTVLAYGIVYYFYAKKLVKGLSKTAVKLKLTEALSNSAKEHNMIILIILGIFGYLFSGFSAFLLIFDNKLVDVELWVACIFFGFCSFVITYMIAAKMKFNKDESNN
jgi:hypothetical protein